MKYGETIFDIIYLTFAIVSGIYILKRKNDKVGKLMGTAVLVLGCGDAFHLIPRILNYFVPGNWTPWLGFGKLVTSITMTIFYVLMYYLWIWAYYELENNKLTRTILGLAVIRIILCFLPQNGWFDNSGTVWMAIIRNLPFLVLGEIIVFLYHKNRNKKKHFKYVWIIVALSFLFYIPVAIGASIYPLLGMLMIPKTICYMVLIYTFVNCAIKTTTD